MASKEEAGKLEWRISIDNGTTERLVPKSGLTERIFLWLKGLVISNSMRKAWRIGADDPAKVVHCLKVGLALSLVSIFYYMRPLYDGVGGNAMWAIMTVVVVFESSVGATFSKCVNRVVATTLAGSLGVAVHWVATQSGKAEIFVIGCSVFLFGNFLNCKKDQFLLGSLNLPHQTISRKIGFTLTLNFVDVCPKLLVALRNSIYINYKLTNLLITAALVY